MVVGGIGTVQTLQSVQTKETSEKGEGRFFALIAGMTGESGITSEKTLPTGNQATNASNEISELLQFLQTNSLIELEDGEGMLNQVMFNTQADLDQLMEEFLGISQEEILKVLEALYSEVTGEHKEFKPLGQPADLSDLYSIIQGIAALPMKTESINLDKDTFKAIKAMKLFELLSAQEGSLDDQVRLREFLQKFGDRLEAMLKGTNSSSRSEFLQKTFTVLVNVMSHTSASSSEKMSRPLGVSQANETVQHQSFFPFQQISRPEQLTLLNSQNSRPVTADQLIEQFQSILSKSHLLKNGETQRLFIRLHPEHLGALRIELIQRDSGMIARIMTSTTAAKEIMESQLNGLKQAFSQQNLQVEKIEISQSLQGQERTFYRDHQQGRENGQHQQEEKKKQQSDSKNQSFRDELLNIES